MAQLQPSETGLLHGPLLLRTPHSSSDVFYSVGLGLPVVRSREGSQVAQGLAQLELVCEHAEILAAFATIS